MTDGVVKFAVDKLEEMAVQELKLQTEVGKKVLELRHELEWLRTFLRDADRKRRLQPPAASGDDGDSGGDLIEVWVRQTRELAHDAEDLLEDFLHKGELHCHGCFDLPSFFRWLRHSAAGVFARHAIFDEIEGINGRIEEMKKYRKECNLEKLSSTSKPHRKQYTDWSTLNELEIEDDLVKIEEHNDVESWLCGESETGPGRTFVIALTGKSGIGKTTLARSLYRRSDIRKHFTCAAWIHVPHKFRFVDLLCDIIRQTTGDDVFSGAEHVRNARSSSKAAEDVIKEKLAGALQRERYLIVLDDVRTWEEWEFFLAALPAGCTGSRVLITTQFKIRAALEQPTASGDGDGHGQGHGFSYLFRIKELKKLSSCQAADLLCKRVYGGKEEEQLKRKERLQNLVDPVTKGSTLPLNVVMFAGLLRSKKEDEWEGVIDSLDDTLAAGEPIAEEPPEKTTQAVKPQKEKKKKKKKKMAARIQKSMSTEKILMACMDDLPLHLKPCLLYFAGFPAETAIDAGKLLRLWVAEGFVQPRNGQTTEERGAECLKELISRCLLQLVEMDAAGNLASVSVHQAVLEFILAEARDTNFLHAHSSTAGLSNGAARRLSLRNTYDSDLGVVLAAPKLHSLLCDIPERAAAEDEKLWQRAMEFINGRSQTFSVHDSRFLRVLDLKGVQLRHRHRHRQSLPEEIGWLIHLRYLGLTYTAMTYLPSSIRKLRNLQTLDVSHTDIEVLPWRFWRIPTLRHVLARRLAVRSAPEEHGVLAGVQTLHGVPWDRWARSGGAIEKMTNLRSIMAWNVTASNQGDALLSTLAGLECLRSLDLEAAAAGVDDDEHGLPLQQLLALLGLRQLQYLTLRGKVAKMRETMTGLPLNHHYLLPNLVKVELHYSRSDQGLIDVLARLPNLAELVLEEESYAERYLRIPSDGFPKLRKLQLSNLHKLTECMLRSVVAGDGEVEEGGQGGRRALPMLQHVSVFHCEMLNKFPADELPKLKLFTVHDSPELKKFLDANAKKANVVQGRMTGRRRIAMPTER